MPVVDENHQEWVFTLYDFDNSGRITKKVMALLLTICKTHEKTQCLRICVCVCVLFYAVGYGQLDAYHL